MLDQEPAVGGKVEGDRGSQAQKLGASELEQNVGAERAQTRYKPQPTEGCGLTRGQHVKGKPWMSARGRAGQRVWEENLARVRLEWLESGIPTMSDLPLRETLLEQVEWCKQRKMKKQKETLLRVLQLCAHRGVIRALPFVHPSTQLYNTPTPISFLGWTGFQVVPQNAEAFADELIKLCPLAPTADGAAPLSKAQRNKELFSSRSAMVEAFRRVGMLPEISGHWEEAFQGRCRFVFVPSAPKHLPGTSATAQSGLGGFGHSGAALVPAPAAASQSASALAFTPISSPGAPAGDKAGLPYFVQDLSTERTNAGAPTMGGRGAAVSSVLSASRAWNASHGVADEAASRPSPSHKRSANGQVKEVLPDEDAASKRRCVVEAGRPAIGGTASKAPVNKEVGKNAGKQNPGKKEAGEHEGEYKTHVAGGDFDAVEAAKGLLHLGDH